MKKVAKIFVCGLAMTAVCMASAEAQDLKDLLNGLGDVVKETVAQNKTVTVAELKGTWKTTGPALVLKSGNIAQQAGGSAMTSRSQTQALLQKVGTAQHFLCFRLRRKFHAHCEEGTHQGQTHSQQRRHV